LEVLATLELSSTSGFLYGANNVQFVRTNGVESLRQGKVLIGTVTYSSAPINFVAVLSNALYVVGADTFLPGARVSLAGLTTRTELNGLTPEIVSANSAGYIASLPHADYGFPVTNVEISGNVLTVTAVNSLSPTDTVSLLGLVRELRTLEGVPLVVATASGTQFTVNPFNQSDVASTPTTGAVCLQDTGTTTALGEGTTYETLVDLPHGQILGTFDASKLRNQFVESGEILFEPDSTYSGKPPAPVLDVPTAVGPAVTLVWTEERPDLVFAYNVEKSTDGVFYSLLQRINSGVSQSMTAALASGSVRATVTACSTSGGFSTYIYTSPTSGLLAGMTIDVSGMTNSVNNVSNQVITSLGVNTFTVATTTQSGGSDESGSTGLAQTSALAYWFRVKAFSADGESFYSNVRTIII
jgi:hypothetical protein